MYDKPDIIAIRYKNFRHKIRIIKKYIKDYKIEDTGYILYMKIRS
jgi:hypothetical protein